MPLGADSSGSKEPCIRWGPDPLQRAIYLGGSCKHMTVLLPPAAAGECACPAHAADERRMHLPLPGVRRPEDQTTMRPLAKYFGHFLGLIVHHRRLAVWLTLTFWKRNFICGTFHACMKCSANVCKR